MRIGVLGTGRAGRTVASKLVELGHEVRMGSRTADNEAAAAWAADAGSLATHGTFADAAAFGELLVNATAGMASIAALDAAGAEHMAGKVLIDIANPLDFSSGFPPSLAVSNTDSLGERIQRMFPDARVVKTLNTVTADVMVDPSLLPGKHVVFVSGDDAEAKEAAADLLGNFGWPAERIVDLGGIETARGAEAFLLLWLPLVSVNGTPRFNIAIDR